MIKLGIIGAGRMGITHYSIINANPDVEIVGVADPSGLVTSLMHKYLRIQVFEDYQDMFNKLQMDAVLVCTPPALHYKVLMAAAEKNIHVFVEKPYTTDVKQAFELSTVFKTKGLVNQVGYVNRFNDIFVELKRLVNLNLIGNLIRFRSEMFSRTIIKPDEGSGWRGSHESGGGAVYEMASHAIDLVNFIIGYPDKITGSVLTKIHSKNVEDAVSSTFIYKNGCSGTIYINWSDESYRKPTNKLELFGTKGKIIADQHTLKIYLNEANAEHGFAEGWNTRYITDVFKPVPFYVRGNEFTRQLFHFIDCIKQKELSNQCDFNAGYETQEIIHKIFDDYKTNGTI